METVLRAEIGSATVLARTGERRLWLLDPTNSVLWDLYSAGIGDGEMAAALSARFDITLDAALDHLDQLHECWRATGLIGSGSAVDATRDEPFEPTAAFAPREPSPAAPDDWWLTVADQHIVVNIEDPGLRGTFEPLLKALRHPDDPSLSGAVADRVRLSGDAASWRLTINGMEADRGSGAPAAQVSSLAALTELGARTPDRLLVVHGAGLIARDGRCLLLVAPGGSGKSTLAVSLEAQGFQLLSDDVVPIRSDGAALGLGLPACVKRGSWAVLATSRPDLEQAPDMLRLGRAVRFLPPLHRPATGAVNPSFLLFPRYEPDAAPRCTPLPPEQALERLVQAEAVIRDLTQPKLEQLCRWVAAIPAHALTYPDLDSAISLVSDILEHRVPAVG